MSRGRKQEDEVVVQLRILNRLLATHMNMQRCLHPCLEIFPKQDEGDELCHEEENECPRPS